MPNESVDFYQGWADIVLKLWKRKILDMDVWYSGQLYESLVSHVVTQSNGDVAKIEFFFLYYGRFSDMGVGREVFRGNEGDLGFSPKRKRKMWYSNVFWGAVKDLSRIVAEKYGKDASKRIVYALRPAKDLKYQMYKERAKSI
jgi:hypothetical protein